MRNSESGIAIGTRNRSAMSLRGIKHPAGGTRGGRNLLLRRQAIIAVRGPDFSTQFQCFRGTNQAARGAGRQAGDHARRLSAGGAQRAFSIVDGLHPRAVPHPSGQAPERPRGAVGRASAADGSFQVQWLYTVHNGKLFRVRYFCATCNIVALEPGNCVCCQQPTELQEIPVDKQD